MNVKRISLEPLVLFERSLALNSGNALIGYANNGRKSFAKIHFRSNTNDAVAEQHVKDIDSIELGVYPENLHIQEFEQFDNDAITAIARKKSLSSGSSFRLFFESSVTPESLIEVPYLGGLEVVESECYATAEITDRKLTEKNRVIERFCWTKTDQACGNGMLGARLSATSKTIGENISKLSVTIYRLENFRQCVIRSTECAETIHLNESAAYPFNLAHISEESLSNTSIQFVPWENEGHSDITDRDRHSNSSIVYSRKVIISIGTQVYLYKLTILPREISSECGLLWKANCELLFCHDAHKSTVLHVLPYSSRLPNLFFSVESGKKLHAWHWQLPAERGQ